MRSKQSRQRQKEALTRMIAEHISQPFTVIRVWETHEMVKANYVLNDEAELARFVGFVNASKPKLRTYTIGFDHNHFQEELGLLVR